MINSKMLRSEVSLINTEGSAMKFLLKVLLTSFFVVSDASAGLNSTIVASWTMADATAVPVVGPYGLVLLGALLALIAVRAVNLKAHINTMLIVGIVGSGVAGSLYIADVSGGFGPLPIGGGVIPCNGSIAYDEQEYVEMSNECPRAVRVTYNTEDSSCALSDLVCGGKGTPCVEDGGTIIPGETKIALYCQNN